MNEWPQKQLDELVLPDSPITYGVVQPGPEDPHGVPFIRSGDVADGRIRVDQLRTISPATSALFERTILHGGELLVSLVGNPGDTAIVPPELAGANIARQVGLVRLDPMKADAHFAKYFFQTMRGRSALFAQTMGSVQQVINLKELRTVKIPNPPLEEQRAIAAVLRRFDAAIDVNGRMNQTTEEIATALFRSLLVDFDPVRALSEGRPTNLPRDVEDLFPRKLVAVDSVEVPDGWNVVGLDEMATFLNGLALQRFPPRGPDSLPAIKIAQLRTMRTNDADRVSAEIPPEYLVEDGDILFSWSGSLTCVLWAGARGALNQHLFKVIPKGTPRWLCYLAIQHHMAEFRRIAAAKATTMGHIQRHHLSEARIAVPPREVLTELSRIFDPLIESTWRRAVTSRTLESLRESLLPRLLSGELGVGIEAVS